MTARLRIKNDRYYAVISYTEGKKAKQKWIALGMPVKNNKRKAELKLEEIKRKYEASYSTPGGDTPFTVYISRWLYKKKPLIQRSTWEGYQIYAEKHIIPYFEPLNLTLRDVLPSHIKEYYEYKYTCGRLDNKGGGLSIPSIKKHGIVLKEVLGEALLENLVIRNAAAGVRLPAKAVSQRTPTFLNSEQANIMLGAFQGHPLRALVYTTLYYGLRRSEVLGLRWSAIDFEKNTLSINHTIVKNRTIEAKNTTKTQSSYHTYRLIEDVKEALLEQREKQKYNRELWGKEYNESDYVFTWDDGKLFAPDYVSRGFKRALKSRGIPVMRFHDLRHSTASILYDKGWDLKDIQLWLRHSSVDVTADIYTHISESRKSRMADSLNNTFSL